MTGKVTTGEWQPASFDAIDLTQIPDWTSLVDGKETKQLPAVDLKYGDKSITVEVTFTKTEIRKQLEPFITKLLKDKLLRMIRFKQLPSKERFQLMKMVRLITVLELQPNQRLLRQLLQSAKRLIKKTSKNLLN